MIQIVSEIEGGITVADVEGKIVFRSYGTPYAFFCEPRMAAKGANDYLNVSHLTVNYLTILKTEEGSAYVTGDLSDVVGDMPLTWVGCFCDTVDEANWILKKSKENLARYDAVMKDLDLEMQEARSGLHGLSVEINPLYRPFGVEAEAV